LNKSDIKLLTDLVNKENRGRKFHPDKALQVLVDSERIITMQYVVIQLLKNKINGEKA